MKERVYFPGLHGLRFFAAIAVVIHHIEQFKGIAKVDYPLIPTRMNSLGAHGVALFYVLSGFLITYLLLKEHKEQQSINIKKFYARRVLRIWPLYYLIVFWSFFLLPRLTDFGGYSAVMQQHLLPTLLLFLFILPHFAITLYPPILGASQAWSIGVEEHFYLIWPILVRFFISRLMPMFIGLIGLKLILLRALASLSYRGELLHWNESVINVLNVSRELLRVFQIEYMTVGAIAAYLFFQGRFKPTSWLLHPAMQILNFVLLVRILGYNQFQRYDLVQATVFALLIVHIVCNSKLWPALDSKPLRYLGMISYGIYMFHPTIVVLLLDRLTAIPAIKNSPCLMNGLLYSLSLVGTVAIAALSYAFFESPFLKLKNRLEVIKTVGTLQQDNAPSTPDR